MDTIGNEKIHVVTGESSLTLILPGHFTKDLGISKDGYWKGRVDGNRLIIEKSIS
jgi:mRNA-degrading endonuclease RelE of RelBE toxin-antitoxin system